MALAHVAGDETERAYRRGDALERRRQLMEAWEHFLERKKHKTTEWPGEGDRGALPPRAIACWPTICSE
jgi:hypothetical protein